MAAVEITIHGALYDKTARTMRPVAIIGEATITGLSVGGGPVYPPDTTPPPDWGGRPPHPEHPIPPRPEHPIVRPPNPPTEPPVEPPTNPPDSQWEWAWNPNTGWIPAFVPGDKPTPPKK